ncbi:MAG: hypothetical protein V3R66_06305 [Rhodospirillales bacterium]
MGLLIGIKWHLAGLAVALAWTPVPSKAASPCKANRPAVQVVVKADNGRVIDKSGHTRGDLKRIQNRHGGMKGAKGWYPLGITVANFQLEMRINFFIKQISPNRFCALAESIDISFGYPEFIVYIDRRYPKFSCEYRAIRRHEEAHIAIHREKLAIYKPWLRDRMAKEARRMNPVIVPTPKLAGERIKKMLTVKIGPLVDKFHKATDSANAKIDTKENYGKIQRLCEKW